MLSSLPHANYLATRRPAFALDHSERALEQPQFDEHGSRYTMVSQQGSKPWQWLFWPGGPGVDACYLKSLIECGNFEGSCWLIDLPDNGNNYVTETRGYYNFSKWYRCYIDVFKAFKHPIIVGHSFGGMFPLLFPALEHVVAGFVSISSAPCLWLEEAAQKAKEHHIKVLTEDMEAFQSNPSEATFKVALKACIPYYFPEHSRNAGAKMLLDLPFNYHAAVWFLREVENIQYNAIWIPMNVPTLILGGQYDYITPLSLFEKDKRFVRDNITIKSIDDAGHLPWFEQPAIVAKHLNEFQHILTSHA